MATSVAAGAVPVSAQAATRGGGGAVVSSAEDDLLARVRAVVVVDESGSLSSVDVAEARFAAELIANSGQFHDDSEVAVIGFGSSDNAGQVAAVDRCPLAPVRSADFARCIPMLHKRTTAEGSGTDHTAALKRALEILDAPGGDDLFKIVFFLTDGPLNVANSPQYGRDEPPGARTTEARRQLEQTVLPEAREMGVQIWPLAFGGGIDPPGLQVLAEGGAGANPACDQIELAGPAPLVAGTANRIGPTILNAVANATCSKPEATEDGVVEEGGTVTLDVEVPITVSTGSINVEKRHPAIEVVFIDPKGRDVTNAGELDGSTFTLGGGTSTAASLGVTHPLPGTWKVRFVSKPGVPQQNVTATVLWKGVLNSSVILDPVAPAPGEPLTVRLRLLTSRNEPITDETMLDPMDFRAVLRGEGFDPIPVPLNDEGVTPDGTAGDGEFAGQVVVPASASGGLCVEGSVFAPGIEGDIRSYCTRPPGERSGGAIIAFGGGEVAPGERLAGTLTVANPGEARNVRLELADVDGATLEPPQVVAVPAGATAFTHEFTITIDPQASIGQRQGVLRAVDADTGDLLGNTFVYLAVDYPPGWAERDWYVFPLIAALLVFLLLVLFLLLRKRARSRADVQQLSVIIQRGEVEVALLNAPYRRSSAFAFDIEDDRGTPILSHALGGKGHHVLERGKRGMLVLAFPDGRRAAFRPGHLVPLSQEGLAVVVHDGRVTSGTPGGAPGAPSWAGGAGGGWADVAPPAWGAGAGAGAGAAGGAWGSGAPAGAGHPGAPDPDATVIPGGYGGYGGGASGGGASGASGASGEDTDLWGGSDAAVQPAPPGPGSNKIAGVGLVVSYSPHDERYREQLQIRLAGLEREGYITSRVDRVAAAGADSEDEGNGRLKVAKVMILLVSPDFLSSDYAYGEEMTRALARHIEGSLRVIPVIVRPSDWEHSQLGQLQQRGELRVLPEGARPVSKWADQNEAWKAVARGVREAIVDQMSGGSNSDS